MNLRLKAKLLLGVFIMSSLFAQTTVFHASGNEERVRQLVDFGDEDDARPAPGFSSDSNVGEEDHTGMVADGDPHDITLATLPIKDIYAILKSKEDYASMKAFLSEFHTQCECKRDLEREEKRSEILEEFLQANPDVVREELEQEFNVPINESHVCPDFVSRYYRFYDTRMAYLRDDAEYVAENFFGKRDEDGNNLLHLIAKDGNPYMIRALTSVLTNSMSDSQIMANMLKVRNENGDMPFHVAVRNANLWFVKDVLSDFDFCTNGRAQWIFRDIIDCLSAKTIVAQNISDGNNVEKDVMSLIKDEINFRMILSTQYKQATGDVDPAMEARVAYGHYVMEMANRYIHDNR